MEFGKLTEIENVKWDLPADDPLSLAFLKSLAAKHHNLEFFIGTPAWGHKEWVGKIYPPKTKATEFLYHYSRNFNTIELNTSHYRIPSPDQVDKWKDQVPNEFRFCPKLYQSISHHETGMLDRGMLAEWFRFLEKLGEKRGICFAQFPPHFDYNRKAVLFHFLQQWPAEFDLALEFRHPSWFQDGRILPALTQYLQKRNIGLVITDVAGRRDVLHTSISADFTMLRFIGNNLHPTDAPRSEKWAERIGQWTHQGLKRVYFMVHEPDDILAPEMATNVIQNLNEIAGANLSPLSWC